MENQHRKIAGYRELSQAEIDLMNRIKAAGENLKALCNEARDAVITQYKSTANPGELGSPHDIERKRLMQANPHAWLDNAEHELSTGIMKLVRAVAQPSTF